MLSFGRNGPEAGTNDVIREALLTGFKGIPDRLESELRLAFRINLQKAARHPVSKSTTRLGKALISLLSLRETPRPLRMAASGGSA